MEYISTVAAKELGPRGIRVNVVSPGVTDTRMARSSQSPEDFERWKKITPLEGRIGTVEEVANAICYLAGPQASWVTAQNVDLTGGL
jgi:3-oxoacyl-[acyl-carrier protein] reductase